MRKNCLSRQAPRPAPRNEDWRISLRPSQESDVGSIPIARSSHLVSL